MLHRSSLAMNLALTTLVSYLDTQPFKNVTVDEFLWGYDEPLVKLASTVLPSWIDFPKFGLLDRVSTVFSDCNYPKNQHIAFRSVPTATRHIAFFFKEYI